MGKTTLVAFRLEDKLLKRIDAYAMQLEQATAGLKRASLGDENRTLMAICRASQSSTRNAAFPAPSPRACLAWL